MTAPTSVIMNIVIGVFLVPASSYYTCPKQEKNRNGQTPNAQSPRNLFLPELNNRIKYGKHEHKNRRFG